jgi:eukaryotic-like serine/threonine-protein kinase
MQKEYFAFRWFSIKTNQNPFSVLKFFLLFSASVVLLISPNLALSQISIDSPFHTYENSDFKIKIDYPISWQRVEESNSILFSSPYESNIDTLQESLVIDVRFFAFEDLFTLDYFINDPNGGFKARAQAEMNNFRIIEESYINFANTPAYKVLFTETLDREGVSHELMEMYIILLISDRAYTIQYIAEPTTFNNYLPIIERMLNSFQVTG